MRQLPSTLTFLDRDMNGAGGLRRLSAQDLFHGTRVCETDYDKLIVGQLTSVADCLREAGLLCFLEKTPSLAPRIPWANGLSLS